jgi:outer membrane protein, heavy metal efflux system
MKRPGGSRSGHLGAMLCLVAGGATSCVSSSIAGDVGRVRELTRIEGLTHIADVEVDPVAAEDARRLLQQPLDADTAVRVALLNNRELRATLREMGIARGRLIQAGLLPNPVVEAELLPERNTQLELRAEYDITSAILTPFRARAAEPELEAARYRAAAAVVELGYRVRIAFYRLQSAEQRLGIAQRVLDAYAAGRDAARAMLEAGNVPELDAASQEIAYERARITVAQLELEVATERERVQRLLGTHGTDTAWRVRGELPVVAEQPNLPDDLETRALRASLDLRESRQRLEGLARRAGFTRTAGWIPDIAVDVHALQGDPEAPEEPSTDGDWGFGAGVSVGIPLFDRRQGTATALEAEFDALMERYYGMAIDLRSATREATSRVSSAHARARQYQEIIVPAQGRVTAQTLLQYNAMQLGIFQLLQARREELDVQLAYVETLREYWSSVAELDALLAGKSVMPEGRAVNASMGGSGESAGEH